MSRIADEVVRKLLSAKSHDLTGQLATLAGDPAVAADVLHELVGQGKRIVRDWVTQG